MQRSNTEYAPWVRHYLHLHLLWAQGGQCHMGEEEKPHTIKIMMQKERHKLLH